MNIVHTPNHYLIILDGVPHGELKTIAMIVLYVLGYFYRNKQDSYAALSDSSHQCILVL